MTAPSSRDPTWFLHEQLGSASPDLLSQMLTTFRSVPAGGADSSSATTAPGDTTMRCYPWTRLPR